MAIISPMKHDDNDILIAKNNLDDLLALAFHHTPQAQSVVVYDTNCKLSTVLSQAYHLSLPNAIMIDYHANTPEAILTIFETLQPNDLVVLVQSTSFRLNAFRMRVELFKRKLKVIEHPHLSRMADDEVSIYIDSLCYDRDYYHHTGHTLKSKIDVASRGILDSGGELLIYDTPFESAKLNIGDYTDMVNIGGQFPLGEVFTEARDLTCLNGRVKIFSFGDVTYKLNYPTTPITLIIHEGKVMECENSTPAFDQILFNIRRDEGVVWVRELGFGLNRAFDKVRTVGDTGTFERMAGVHLSLGAKHGIYGKPGFKRRDGMYHVDVFADTNTFSLDNEIVYQKGRWTL